MTVRILTGDCRELLSTLDAESVQACVTSPPYWGGQRDYGMAGQLGMERTPEEYAASLVGIMRGVRCALHPTGVLWLNLGDSYAASGRGGGGSLMVKRQKAWGHREQLKGFRGAPPGYKPKDIVGVPWLVAFALRADGWFLRRDVVWEKAVATEPTRADRPSTAHEIVFLLSRTGHYYFDRPTLPTGSVWKITSDGAYETHNATMPAELARRCIASGSRLDDTVLDPFGGAGTTGLVAERLGRHAVLLELNPDYAAMARARITADAPLFSDGVA